MDFSLLFTQFLTALGLQSLIQSDSRPLIPVYPDLTGVEILNMSGSNLTSNSKDRRESISHSLQSCGLSTNSSKSISTRIIGGKDVGIDEFPWQVSILRKGTHFCGGALILPNWIITAAHCLQWAMSGRRVILDAQNSIRVVFGSQYVLPSLKSSIFRVIKIESHPNYSTDTEINDIALIKINTPSNFLSTRNSSINTLCLPNKGQEFSGTVTTSGWGSTVEEGQLSHHLKAVDLPLKSAKMCKRIYRRQFNTETMICAGEEGKDSCQGDSGGALIKRDQSGRATLIGIVSVGNGCGRRGFPGIYTKASFYIDWIQKTIA